MLDLLLNLIILLGVSLIVQIVLIILFVRCAVYDIRYPVFWFFL